MPEPSTVISAEKERLFEAMEAELAEFNRQVQSRQPGDPMPPEPQYDRKLFREMRCWQGARLQRKLDEWEARQKTRPQEEGEPEA